MRGAGEGIDFGLGVHASCSLSLNLSSGTRIFMTF